MSASRPPLSNRQAFLPDEIARREFATAFRGYDQAEVRTFLNQLSEQNGELGDRIAQLHRELNDMQSMANAPELDEETVTRLLGAQTAQILRSAREAAGEMRQNAEEEVSRSLREAHEVSTRMRTEAEDLLANRTAESNRMAEQSKLAADEYATKTRADADQDAQQTRAAIEAEATQMREDLRVEKERLQADNEARMEQELEGARQRGRDIVETARVEAQNLVNRTAAEQEEKLAVLVRKRSIALAQVEELRAGRQRLLKAYKMVRGTLDEVTQELQRVESEARQAAGLAGVTAAQTNGIAQEELDTVVELEQYSLNDDVPQSVIDLINGKDEPTPAMDASVFDGADEEDVPMRPRGEWGNGDDLPGTRSDVDVRENDGQPSYGEGQFSGSTPRNADAPQNAAGNTTMMQRQQADEITIEEVPEQQEQLRVFDGEAEMEEERQRITPSSFVIGESYAANGAEMDRNQLMRRDSVITKNRPQAVRRLKRALQDEQDALVAQLRSGSVSSVNDLLGSNDDQATTYQRAVVRLFRDVVRSGASSVQGSTGVENGTIDHAGTNAARSLAVELSEDLRSQLEPVLEELISGEELPDANSLQAMIGGPYSVVKGDYLDHLVDDRIAGAFDQGAALAN